MRYPPGYLLGIPQWQLHRFAMAVAPRDAIPLGPPPPRDMHDQIVGPEGLFKVELGSFFAQEKLFGGSDFPKNLPPMQKLPNSILNCFLAL